MIFGLHCHFPGVKVGKVNRLQSLCTSSSGRGFLRMFVVPFLNIYLFLVSYQKERKKKGKKEKSLWSSWIIGCSFVEFLGALSNILQKRFFNFQPANGFLGGFPRHLYHERS